MTVKHLKQGEIALRPLLAEDADQIASLANDREVWLNLRNVFPHPYSPEDAKSFIEFNRNLHPQRNFGILRKNELTGIIGFTLQEDIYTGTSEIGYWLGRKYWGIGIATQAVKLMLTYGFEDLNLRRIYACLFNNDASARVLEKCGFSFEGISRNAVLKNGTVWDEYRYSILRTEFEMT